MLVKVSINPTIFGFLLNDKTFKTNWIKEKKLGVKIEVSEVNAIMFLDKLVMLTTKVDFQPKELG